MLLGLLHLCPVTLDLDSANDLFELLVNPKELEVDVVRLRVFRLQVKVLVFPVHEVDLLPKVQRLLEDLNLFTAKLLNIDVRLFDDALRNEDGISVVRCHSSLFNLVLPLLEHRQNLNVLAVEYTLFEQKIKVRVKYINGLLKRGKVVPAPVHMLHALLKVGGQLLQRVLLLKSLHSQLIQLVEGLVTYSRCSFRKVVDVQRSVRHLLDLGVL
mmetsp:Transcript_16242/g.33385  ORF Transcript_16242/g.33385 Transcript_16242/m.33385 type:complete len:213 (-) Transcript_16242:4278-4916(-)